MRRLRLLMIAVATICVMALVALAFASRPAQQDPSDDIIIRSKKFQFLEIQCGKNDGADCLGTNDNQGKYKHKRSNAHIMEIVVWDFSNNPLFHRSFDAEHQPQIEMTYKELGIAMSYKDDIMIIKGGSLEVQCAKNHGTDCLGTSDDRGRYKHKKSNAYIMQIVVRDLANNQLFSSSFDPEQQPQIAITYKETAAKPSPSPPIVSASPQPLISEAASITHDTDQFKTFDELPSAEQEAALRERGPRLPEQYNVSDLSMRVFVAAGWPVVLDYGLDSDAPAVLTVDVKGADPLIRRLEPTQRAQFRVRIPAGFGDEPQVGKLKIQALDSNNRAANFHLYGIAMGDRGVHALWKANTFRPGAQLALNRARPGPTLNFESYHLFPFSSAQEGSSLHISVNPPTTINPTERPQKLISFSFTSQSDFSNGRWEVWLVNGLDWQQVWQTKTGNISPHQSKSQTWNGMISDQTISVGEHALQLTAWHGRERDRAWVVARTAPILMVKK